MGAAQSNLVRALALSILQSALLLEDATAQTNQMSNESKTEHTGQARSSSSATAVVDFIRHLVLVVLRRDVFCSAALDAAPFGHDAQRKSRVWQAVCILAPRCKVLFAVSDALFCELHDAAFADLLLPNGNQTRQFIELFLVHLMRTRPRLLLRRALLPTLRERSAELLPAVGCSLLIVAGFSILAMPAGSALLAEFAPEFLIALFPWLTSKYISPLNNFANRHFHSVAVF